MLLWIIIIIAFATLIKSILGFGDALISIPILIILVGAKTAVPLMALIAITSSLILLLLEFRSIQFQSIKHLLLASFFGIPLGLLLLHHLPDTVFYLILAFVIVLYSSMSLMKTPSIKISEPISAYAFGFFAGILGGACNVNGPLLVIYGTLSRWPKDVFRACLQGFFIPNGIIILAGHALTGLWTVQVFTYYFYCLPVIGISFLIGNLISKKIPQEKFERWIHYFLLFFATMLILKSLF